MIADRATGGGLTALVLLSLWMGAAVTVAAVVAPAAFAVLPTRSLAGALVGRVLPTLFWSGAAVGLVVTVLGRSPAAGRAMMLSPMALTIACLAAQLLVAPRIERLRSDAAMPIDRLAPNDARRVTFGRLHAASVALLGVAAIAGAATLLFTARALHTTGRATSSPASSTLRTSPDDG